MNKRKILENNIKNCGFETGRSIKGKGLEIILENKVVCHISVSKYDSSLESQQKLVLELLPLHGYLIASNYMSDSEDEVYDEGLLFEWNNARQSYYSDDYKLEHGSKYTLDKDFDATVELDGRVLSYHGNVINDFWEDTLKCEVDNYLKEIDPNDTICVYHRKGKDWYVTYSTETIGVQITHKDEDELIENDFFYVLTYNENESLKNKFVDWFKGLHKYVDIKSYLYNELEITDYFSDYEVKAEDKLFNLQVVDFYCLDKRKAFAETLDGFIDYKSDLSASLVISKAYEKFLVSNIDLNKKILNRYTHLQKLEKIAISDGRELIYSKVGEFSDDMLYAIKYKKEEYHFTLSELLNTTPKKFYKQCITNLTMRLNERYKNSMLLNKASTVFVGLEDSYGSGNCKSGTSSWCEKFGIDTKKIGAIRGDELLKIDYSSFTKRCVLHALERVA